MTRPAKIAAGDISPTCPTHITAAGLSGGASFAAHSSAQGLTLGLDELVEALLAWAG